MRRHLPAALALLLAACAGSEERAEEAPPAAASSGAHRAALVVTHGDGATETVCVRFAEAELSGIELLRRSGLDHAVEFSRSQGSYALCSLDGEGCGYPDESCFCRPQYWSYWIAEGEAWILHPVGLSSWQVRDGSIFGTRWGDGTSSPAQPPVSLAALCGDQARLTPARR